MSVHFTVGMIVCFKSDVEQVARVTKVEKTRNGTVLTLTSLYEEGFEGEYIGGQMTTTEPADRCWLSGT